MSISIPPDWIPIAQLLVIAGTIAGILIRLLRMALGSIRIKVGAACNADLPKKGKLTLKIEVTWGQSPRLISYIIHMLTVNNLAFVL
jgi:hypothetical protein